MATGCQNVEDVMLTPKAGYSFAKDANLTPMGNTGISRFTLNIEFNTLAVYARQLAIKLGLQILRGHRRPLLLCWRKLQRQPWGVMSLRHKKIGPMSSNH